MPPGKAHLINGMKNLEQVSAECGKWAQESKAQKLVVLYEGEGVYSDENAKLAYDLQNCIRRGYKGCSVEYTPPFSTIFYTGQGYLTRSVLDAMIKECGEQFEFIVLDHRKERYAQRDKPTYAATCIGQFLKAKKGEPFEILVGGHSNGVAAGVLVGTKLVRAGLEGNFSTIMVDGVQRGYGPDPDRINHTSTTPGRDFTYLFQEHGSLLPSKVIFKRGSGNDIFIPLTNTGVGHTHIVLSEKVLGAFRNFCKVKPEVLKLGGG